MRYSIVQLNSFVASYVPSILDTCVPSEMIFPTLITLFSSLRSQGRFHHTLTQIQNSLCRPHHSFIYQTTRTFRMLPASCSSPLLSSLPLDTHLWQGYILSKFSYQRNGPEISVSPPNPSDYYKLHLKKEGPY